MKQPFHNQMAQHGRTTSLGRDLSAREDPWFESDVKEAIQELEKNPL